MGIILEKTSGQSELQERIAAELKAKAAARSKQEGQPAGGYHDAPDGVKDAAFMKGTKETTSLAPVWFGVFILGIAVTVYVIYQVSR